MIHDEDKKGRQTKTLKSTSSLRHDLTFLIRSALLHFKNGYLKRIEILLGEFRSIMMSTREDLQAITELVLVKTASNGFPMMIVVHTLLHPLRVVTEPILLISLSGDSFARAFVGDHKGEDGETKDHDD